MLFVIERLQLHRHWLTFIKYIKYMMLSLIVSKISLKESHGLQEPCCNAHYSEFDSEICFYYRIEHSVEEKTSKWQSGGSAKLDLLLDYTALTPIDEENIEAEADKPIGQIQGGEYIS